MEPTDIRRRYETLKSERKTLENTFQQIEQYVVPYRGKFFRENTSEHEVDWRNTQLFDTTAIQACDTLASSMQGALTSPATIWFDFQFQNEDLNKHKESMVWLEQCARECFDALQESNFNIEASEFYLDLCSFGTAIVSEEVVSEDEWQGIDFQAIPVRDAFFEPDHKQQIQNFYRRLQWTAIQIVDKFGAKNVPKDILAKAEGSSATNDKIEIIFCIFKRPDVKPPEDSGPIPPLKRPYGYKYVLHRDSTVLGKEGGYYEQPAFVARWRKVSGSMWGHSPAMICLPDILNANDLVDSTLEAAGKVVDPASLTTQRGLVSDLDLARGGLTVVRNIGDLVPYETKARFDVGDGVLNRFQDSINRTFRVDQLQLKESPAMTATEVQVRYEMMQRLLGPTLGRLQNDFLNPMVQRTFNILLRAGRLPEIPEEVATLGGQLKVEYTGPLPRAQKMETVRSMQEWLAVIAEAGQLFPELNDLPDPDVFGRLSAKLMSVPSMVLRSQEEVAEKRDQREAAQQAAVEAQQAQMEGEAKRSQGEGEQAMAQAQANPELQEVA